MFLKSKTNKKETGNFHHQTGSSSSKGKEKEKIKQRTLNGSVITIVRKDVQRSIIMTT